jgi:K+-sensing histidine kinase KdpD
MIRCDIHHFLKSRPWSFSALLVAVLAFAFAIATRMCLAYLGTSLYFATFVPAVLMASLLAGMPAGVLTTLATIPTVWWAFLPPTFEFNPLNADDYRSFFMFLLCSAFSIWFAQLCRRLRASERR